jgi:hypothetical protein
MSVLSFGRDVQGFNAYAPQVSNRLYASALTANTVANLTIPSDFSNYMVLFSYSAGATVWVDMSGANAVIPTLATISTVTAELLPGQRQVTAGSQISLITADQAGTQVGFALYGIP